MIEIVDVQEKPLDITKELAQSAVNVLQAYCSNEGKCADCYFDNGAECVLRYPYLWKVVKEKGKENGSK